MALYFYASHFFLAAQMTAGLAELSCQESLDKIPSHATIYLAGYNGMNERNYNVRIIVVQA
jgi:hypothetical protein